MNAHPGLRTALLALAVTMMLMVPPLAPVQAITTWYVAPGGNDGNACTSEAAPCATISGALGKAAAGGTIKIATGTYTGSGVQVVLVNKNITLSVAGTAPLPRREAMPSSTGRMSAVASQ